MLPLEPSRQALDCIRRRRARTFDPEAIAVVCANGLRNPLSVELDGREIESMITDGDVLHRVAHSAAWLESSQSQHELTEDKQPQRTRRHRDSLCLGVSVADSLCVLHLLCVEASGLEARSPLLGHASGFRGPFSQSESCGTDRVERRVAPIVQHRVGNELCGQRRQQNPVPVVPGRIHDPRVASRRTDYRQRVGCRRDAIRHERHESPPSTYAARDRTPPPADRGRRQPSRARRSPLLRPWRRRARCHPPTAPDSSGRSMLPAGALGLPSASRSNCPRTGRTGIRDVSPSTSIVPLQQPAATHHAIGAVGAAIGFDDHAVIRRGNPRDAARLRRHECHVGGRPWRAPA